MPFSGTKFVRKPLELLLVEDNPGDVALIKESLQDSNLLINLNVLGDGTKALAYLYKEKEYINAIRPDLIILDLNLPKQDGKEVLSEIKTKENLKSIPVVVLTTSSADEDIRKAYCLGANCYITKPIGLDDFLYVVKSIVEFWFVITKLPVK